MARARSSSPSRTGAGAAAPRPPGLPARLHRLLAATAADQPLPTTRELGERFGVANSTVARVLRRLTDAGDVWQHPVSGRYFPTGARLLLDRPKPVACLIRRLELGSALYRELLEGISTGCGAARRTMLLWHDELLVSHPDPGQPPAFASAAEQTAILAEFLERHGGAAGGFILDHVWSDAALRAHAERLRPAVVLFRACPLEAVGNVRADLRAGALKAFGHLLGRGYETVLPVTPFAGDPAVEEFGRVLSGVADELDCRSRLEPPVAASTPEERQAIARRLRGVKRRTALLCPEDHVAAMLATALGEAGVGCPDPVGVLAVMGTARATAAGLSCLRYDFRQLGRSAVEALSAETPVRIAVEPALAPGATT
jgi:DNA-binding LacI/PurR family transcriptional regulator